MLSGTRSALAPCRPAPKLLHRRREGFDRERGDLANVRHGLQPSEMSASFDMEAIRAFRALDPVGHFNGALPEGLDLPCQSWLIMVHLRHEVRGDGWFSGLDFSTLMNGLSV